MKILHTVEFYEPFKGGAQEVVKQLSERMVAMGHDVTVATTKLKERKSKTINGVKIEEFDISGNEVRGYAGDTESYKKFLLKNEFDIVMNYAAQQWATDIFFEVIDEVKAGKVFVPCGFSGLYDPAYKQYFKKMPSELKKYDATVYLAEKYRDIDFAKKHKIKNLNIIPNGAGANEFDTPLSSNIRNKYGIKDESFLVTTIGSHTGVKGHSEAISIFKKSKIKNSTLLIIGNLLNEGCGPGCSNKAAKFNKSIISKLKKQKIIVKYIIRKDTVQLLKSSDLFLFPSNIEASPIVLFEACAAKTPFLVTDVGNSKEIINWTNGGKLLPTYKDEEGFSHAKINDSVAELQKIYNNPKLREQMATQGYKAWKAKYSWEKITEQYLKLYKKVLKK
jgi:glycosyltransferase involved in cell wall biosynthesis